MPEDPDRTHETDVYAQPTVNSVGLRNRLEKLGPKALSSTDLLTLIVGSPRVAASLVRRHGLSGLASLPREFWKREQGVGRASAARICAVFELGRRTYSTQAEASRPKVCRPQDAFKHVRHLARLKKEHLVGLYLDAQNGLIHSETISMGALNTTRTHPREILHPAVVHMALGFILAHNHPSGSLDPSPEDVEFTRAIRRAGEIVGIELYDHLVVAGAGFVSMRERGML